MIRTERRRAFRQKLFLTFLMVLALASARQLIISPSHGQDFRDFFAAGTLVAEGRDPYDAGALSRQQDALYNQPQHLKPGDPAYYDAIPYPQGPWVAITLAPFSRLPWQAAYGIYLVLAMVAVALAAFALLRELGWSGRPLRLALLATLLSPVVFINVFQGQPVPFLLAAFAAAFVLLRRDRPVLAGALLAIAWIKPHLGLPLLVVLLLLRPGAARGLLAGFAAGTVALFAIATLVLKGALLEWPRVVLGQWSGALQQADMASVNALYYPALHGGLRQAILIVVLIGAGLYAAWSLRQAQPRIARAITVLLLSLLAAPYAHSYDTLLLLPVVLVLLGPGREGWSRPAVEAALWAFAIFPVFYFAGFHLGYFNGFSAIPVALLALAWHLERRDLALALPLAEAA